MPDPPASSGGNGTPFAPRALVAVRVGALTIMLYPVVDQSMLPHERAHAFHYNKTALAAQNIDLRLQLDALGTQLNLIATVDGTINDWFRFFYDSWFDFSKLTILSFHNAKGDIMTNTTDVADPSVLLPVANGAVVGCRKKDVKFVRVQLMLDYASLINVNPPGATVLRTEYYIELPQTSVAMTDGAGNAYNLLTFHGPEDLRTMSAADVQAQVLDVTFQDVPVDLQPSKFNLTSARTDSSEMRSDIEGKIVRLASATVWHTMFLELCPGYSMQPWAAIDHVRQVFTDRDGNQVVSTVQAYFQQLMGAARPFSGMRDFPVSLCARFQDGLDSRLQTGYRRNFPQHSVVQPLAAAHQRKTLQAMLQAAQQAEDDLLAIQRISREAMGLSQAFHAGAVATGAPPAVGAYPSQAEMTLRRYPQEGGHGAGGAGGGGTAGRDRGLTCFGCGGPHPWSEFHEGRGGQQGHHVVICPNRDNPGIRDHAAKQIENMRKNRKKRHSRNLKRKNLGTANFADFDEEGQNRIREQVLQANGDQTSVASSVTTQSPPGADRGRGRGRGRGGGVILIADVVVLAAGTPLKRAMPISIQSNLPHIVLQFGADYDTPNCPSICCAVDLCAALTTGNFHFFASVAKRYPHCVAKIYTPEDYAPIVLSGIVSSDAASITTELGVGFLFHLPYRTKDGDTASLMVATGPNVSVNTIIGLPFMKASGMILDLVDEVVDCKYLDCPPFPVDFRRTSNHVPVLDDGGTLINHATSYVQLITEINNLERYYEAKVVAGSTSEGKTSQSVHFGTKSTARDAGIDAVSTDTGPSPDASLQARWVPPSQVYEDEDDYPSSALEGDEPE